eukprot:CAMPEP_0119111538 /NCGR_PEP_ID=MMETSP1180-20130426/36111_1 /TAXON_ID=3052 ORGANISM="Chlamydomonas cf sp, Strain CCMP681" /NCGR_SAMPLE_ID=MMETSP1180 /ASSEMBLY_ACC=CAM_ASM_000741 /LENGTH=32 /DNA_ID= /DNA_START= /DNA_END= /DNA_ORIENTATION=
MDPRELHLPVGVCTASSSSSMPARFNTINSPG